MAKAVVIVTLVRGSGHEVSISPLISMRQVCAMAIDALEKRECEISELRRSQKTDGF